MHDDSNNFSESKIDCDDERAMMSAVDGNRNNEQNSLIHSFFKRQFKNKMEKSNAQKKKNAGKIEPKQIKCVTCDDVDCSSAKTQ